MKWLILLVLVCASCLGRDDTFRGRVTNKQRIASNCVFDYNYTTKSGTVVCDEERLALTLDDNSALSTGKYCYVSDRVFQETEVGSLFTCQYGENK